MIRLLFQNVTGDAFMTIDIRPMREADVNECGRICYEAFYKIATSHGFHPDFPNVEYAVQLQSMLCANPYAFSVVAESNGRVIGSNHLWEADEIRAVGPITVDTASQAKGAGRMLMESVIARGGGGRGIRLVQDAFNATSMALYASLGFDAKEPLVLMEGPISGDVTTKVEVRLCSEEDYPRCADLCRSVYGFDRTNEMRNMRPWLPSFVGLRGGKLVAYASAPHVWVMNHAVAETDEDMTSLLSGVGRFSRDQPLSFLLPIRQSSLFRWCLKHGMRVVKPLTLMSMGDYIEPRGSWMPSVGY
ncbi:MAG: GNAT family N-acetyltransferase [Blastocatellia bacterium]|nr:MAG: GNAT family N-acetyltransferase [Blastocatellia bacterium]